MTREFSLPVHESSLGSSESVAGSPRASLSKAQIREYREAFRTFDRDSSGAISTKELQQLLKSMNMNLSEEEVAAMISTADADGSGEIEFSEFLSLMLHRNSFLGAALERASMRLTLQRRSFKRLLDNDDGEVDDDGEVEEIPPTHLPLRRALAALRHAGKLKSFLCFTLFYVSYISLSTIRLGWWLGHETLEWLDEAHEAAGKPPPPTPCTPPLGVQLLGGRVQLLPRVPRTRRPPRPPPCACSLTAYPHLAASPACSQASRPSRARRRSARSWPTLMSRSPPSSMPSIRSATSVPSPRARARARSPCSDSDKPLRQPPRQPLRPRQPLGQPLRRRVRSASRFPGVRGGAHPPVTRHDLPEPRGFRLLRLRLPDWELLLPAA